MLIALLLLLGLFSAPHGLDRTLLSGDRPIRADQWAWFRVDGADFRDSDVHDQIDRVMFRGYIRVESDQWRVSHTGRVQLAIDDQIVLQITETRPITETVLTIPSNRPFVQVQLTYFHRPITYAAGDPILLQVEELTPIGIWQPIPTHRLSNTPPTDPPREALIYWLTRVILLSLAIGIGVQIVRYLRREPVLIAVIVLALILRLIVLSDRAANDPFFAYLQPGSDNYVLMARETLIGDSHLAGAFYSPGNTLWLVVLTTIVGAPLMQLYLVNAILGAFSISAIVMATRSIAGHRAGIGAGVIAAIFPPLIFYHTTLQLEAVLSILLPFALWFGIKSLSHLGDRDSAIARNSLPDVGDRDSAIARKPLPHVGDQNFAIARKSLPHVWGRDLGWGFGLLIGLLTLTRLTHALIGLAFTLALLAIPLTPRQRLTVTLIAALSALIVIFPQTLANLSVGQRDLVNANGPDTLYWALNRDGNGSDVRGEAWYIAPIRGQTYSQALIADLQADPLRMIQLTLHKWGLLWSNTDIANNVDYHQQGLAASPLLNLLALRGLWGPQMLILFGLTGLALIRDRPSRHFLLWVCLLLTLSTVIFTVFGRMRVPFWILFAIGAGITLDRMIARQTLRRVILFGLISLTLIGISRFAKDHFPQKAFFTGPTPIDLPLDQHLRIADLAPLESRCVPGGYLFITVTWQLTAPPPNDHRIRWELHDLNTTVIAQREVTLGTISYPPIGTTAWPIHRHLRESYLILIPPDAPHDLTLMLTLNDRIYPIADLALHRLCEIRRLDLASRFRFHLHDRISHRFDRLRLFAEKRRF